MKRRSAYVTSCILAGTIYIIMAVLHFVSVVSFGNNGIFRRTSKSIWRKYWAGIGASTPTEYLVWIAVHLFQALWMTYGVTLLKRKVFLEASLRGDPPFLPVKLFLVYALALLFLIASFFTWDRELLWVAMIFVALAQIHLVLCLFISLQSISNCKLRLVHFGNSKEILLVILLVHNGLGLFAVWLGFLATFHLAVVVVYSFDGGIDVASGMALAIIGLEMVIFAVLDMVYAWRHTLYLITPYLGLVTGFAGIVAETEELNRRDLTYELGSALLAMAVILNFLKIFHTSYRVIWKGYSYDHCVADVDCYPSPMHGYGASPEVGTSGPADIDAPVQDGMREMQIHRAMVELGPIIKKQEGNAVYSLNR